MKTAAIGAVVGFLVFLLIYGFSPLNPLNEQFVLTGYLEKDVAQHYAGWKLFRNSPWSFPLGVGELIEAPYGNSVSYTDSIPLFAIFFKALSPILPHTFQYFGIFVALCFVLQGAFGALLVSLFADCPFYCGLGAALFSFAPILLERAFRHCALTAQFLIIAALYYYFKNKKSCSKSYLPFYIINAAAITIHPYFIPFTFAIMFAFAVEDFFLAKNRWKPWVHIVLSIAVTLAVGYITGAFFSGEILAATGYGYFSLNLNAFFNPVSVEFTGEHNWSRLLGDRPYFGGQIEGFNYLGLGIIAAGAVSFAVTFLKDFKSVITFVKNRFGLIFVTFCLTVFALGDAVYFGGLKIFDIPYPDALKQLFGMFRATGRFGYMLHYLIILFALYSIYKFFSAFDKKIAFAVMTVLFAVQIFDISDVLIEKHDYFYSFSEDNRQYETLIAQHPFWADAVQRVDGVVEICDIHQPLFGNGMIDLASVCGEYGKGINSNFCARFNYVLRQKRVETHNYLFDKGECRNYLFIMDNLNHAQNILENGISQAFVVDSQLVMLPALYTDEEIASFTAAGNFEQVTDYAAYMTK
ncbi:MAG: hypothetical protein E7488_04605 [Ruminococcaceae bacterium]|nr:hypothetical protein [Oscillospiraceae bacterium]